MDEKGSQICFFLRFSMHKALNNVCFLGDNVKSEIHILIFFYKSGGKK